MTNPYHDAMDRCTPPEGMGERLAQNVLSALPGRAGAFKPRGFRRKGAALLLAAVLLLGTGATTIWDPLFVRRFGPQAAMSALGGAVFQKLDLTSVCDDVALTIPQALCSDKSIHYILEYQLPEGFSLEEGEYFVLGDNRNNSEDSRFANVGTVVEGEIIGRAWLRLNEFGFVGTMNLRREEGEEK